MTDLIFIIMMIHVFALVAYLQYIYLTYLEIKSHEE